MLPREYTRVEWIESTGSQYIDTGVIGRNGLSIEGAFMANSLENAKIMGCYSPGRFYPLAFNDGVLALGYDSSWYNSTKTIQAGIKYNFAVSITANRQTVSIDGETCISGANTGNITTNVNMYLCAFNDSDLYPDGYFKGRIYPTKFKLNGTFVRDYIPCIDANGDANLWDDVNETLAEKVGTFVAGPVPLAPSAPVSLRTALAIRLLWDPVSGADYYNIYRDGELIGTTSDAQYIDTTAAENATYTYGISAANGGGESAQTELIVYTRSGYFLYKPYISTANFP